MVDDVVSEALRLVRWANRPAMSPAEIQAYLRYKYKDVRNLIVSNSERVIAAREPEAGLANRKTDATQWLDDFFRCWRFLNNGEDISTVRVAGLEAIEAAFVLGCLVGESGGGDEMR